MRDKRKEKTATDVIINGKLYSITGADSVHIQNVAAFLNRKYAEIKTTPSYNRLSDEYKTLLMNINLGDEYFKAVAEGERLLEEKEELERELYAVKHDIANTKIKLDNSLKQQEILEKRCEEWKQKYNELKEDRGDDYRPEGDDGIILLDPKAQ